MGQPKIKEMDEFEPAFSDELEPGHTLMQGQYTIEEFLNAGGFGITYRAKDSLDRVVVIKECFPGSFCRRTTTSVQARSRAHKTELSSIVRLFVEEARSLARLDHPNIVGVHQVFEENNTAYMALDFVEGRDLLDMIENPDGVLEPEQIEEILRKLLDAVGFIHGQGMLHRDISPDNILLKPNMEPILIDFGAAREEASKQSRVLSAMRVVKDGYSPQEFYISGAIQGQFSDLYALGATFYHLITGELPVVSQSRLAAVAAGEKDPYVPVFDRMPEYSDAFLHGIDKALAILPKDRVPTAQHWLDLLNGSTQISDLDTSIKSGKKKVSAAKVAWVPKPKSATKGKARLLGGVALILPIIGGFFALQMDDRSPSADEAIGTLVLAEATLVPDAAVPTEPSVTAENDVFGLSGPAAQSPSGALDAALVEAASDIALIAPVASTETTSQLLGLERSPDPVASILGLEAAPDTDTAVDDIIPNAQDAAATVLTAPTLSDVLNLPAVSDPDIAALQSETATLEDPSDLIFSNTITTQVENPAIPVETSTSQESILNALAATVDTTSISEPTREGEVEVTAAEMNILQNALLEEAARETPVLASQVNIERFDLPEVTSAWSLDMTDVLPDATDTIYAINDVPLGPDAQIDTILHQRIAAPDGETITVSVLLGATEDVAVAEMFTVPVVHKTLFNDGTLFETRMIDGAWNTIVTDVPAGRNLEIGDTLVGDLSTGALFDTRTSLPDTLVRTNAENIERITIAVRRGNIVIPIDMPIPR